MGQRSRNCDLTMLSGWFYSCTMRPGTGFSSMEGRPVMLALQAKAENQESMSSWATRALITTKIKQTEVEEKAKPNQHQGFGGRSFPGHLKHYMVSHYSLAIHQLDYPNFKHLSHSSCCCVRVASSSYCSSPTE